ncbi:hypothetical protein [Acetobacterium carbinolicum]|uniref:hypothetical protein n=1 Tax=Acetobacterium carbinolicum TaxID=52690 RepID=UPI0039C91CD3
MAVWNVKKYKTVLQQIKDRGELNGKTIKCKEDIYKEVEKKLHLNPETVKSWTRPSSNGPGFEVDRKNLEEFLGVPDGSLMINKEQKEVAEMQAIIMTDFNKNAILHCYELMKDYLHDDEIEDEECFSQMCAEVEKQKIAIPRGVYQKISQFIDERLAPIIYERKETFSECYRADIGFYNDEGKWEVKNEESMKKMCMAFIVRIFEIEQELDNFAMNDLHPLLV